VYSFSLLPGYKFSRDKALLKLEVLPKLYDVFRFSTLLCKILRHCLLTRFILILIFTILLFFDRSNLQRCVTKT